VLRDFRQNPQRGTEGRGTEGQARLQRFNLTREKFWRAEEVTFRFDGGLPHGPKGGRWGEVTDFTVPVTKREPLALTLFFSNDDEDDSGVLEQLPDQIEARALTVIPCIPNRVC
jgi:hypothetical protein